jgi:broad specificity polyphosphatase/5'/3'-nucleotidase SurE
MTNRLLLAAALLGLPAAASSQALFKCVDAKGKITYQETACPANKDQKKVDTSHAGKTDWERAANEKVRRMQENAEAEAAYQGRRAWQERAEREEQRRKEEKEYWKRLQAGGEVQPPSPPAK